MKNAAIFIGLCIAAAWAAYITQQIRTIERIAVATCAYAHAQETGIITGRAGSDRIVCPETSD